MQTERGIVRTYRCSDGLYMIPDGTNTLTHQSAGTNDAPRGLLYNPVTPDKLTDLLFIIALRHLIHFSLLITHQ